MTRIPEAAVEALMSMDIERDDAEQIVATVAEAVASDPAVIERGAQAIELAQRDVPGAIPWERMSEMDRDYYREHFTAGLRACLGIEEEGGATR